MNQPIHFLLIDSAYPINTRNTKILNSIQKYNGKYDTQISICAWNRENKSIPPEGDYFIWKKKSPGGQLMKKLFNMFGYFFYLKKINRQLSPEVIIASHWDMLLLSSLFKRKKQILIYENLDIPSATSNFLVKTLRKIESFSMKNVDITVLASRFYEPLYKNKKHEIVTLENKPIFTESLLQHSERKKGEKLQISYIGGIRYLEILKNLVAAVKNNPKIDLYFHGEGHDLELIELYSEGSNNVYFTGRYEYSEIKHLYDSSDIVWAAYPNKDYNVKYAISNKFHESMCYNVPCIFSIETCLADLVEDKRIGFTVDPYSIESIRILFDQIIENRDSLSVVKNRLQEYTQSEKSWEEQFSVFMQVLDEKIRVKYFESKK